MELVDQFTIYDSPFLRYKTQGKRGVTMIRARYVVYMNKYAHKSPVEEKTTQQKCRKPSYLVDQTKLGQLKQLTFLKFKKSSKTIIFNRPKQILRATHLLFIFSKSLLQAWWHSSDVKFLHSFTLKPLYVHYPSLILWIKSTYTFNQHVNNILLIVKHQNT